MNKLLLCFENLGKSYEKARTVMARENLTIPRFYIRYLAELEDFVNAQWEDAEAKKVVILLCLTYLMFYFVLEDERLVGVASKASQVQQGL